MKRSVFLERASRSRCYRRRRAGLLHFRDNSLCCFPVFLPVLFLGSYVVINKPISIKVAVSHLFFLQQEAKPPPRPNSPVIPLVLPRLMSTCLSHLGAAHLYVPCDSVHHGSFNICSIWAGGGLCCKELPDPHQARDMFLLQTHTACYHDNKQKSPFIHFAQVRFNTDTAPLLPQTPPAP